MGTNEHALWVAVLDAVAEPVALTERGVISWANRATFDWFEKPAADLIGSPCEQLIAPDEREAFQNHLRAQKTAVFVGHTVNRNGGRVPMEVECIGTALMFRPTAARGPASEALMMSAIVNSSEDAIIGKSLDGIVTSWNPGAERIFGYSAKEMIGRTVSMLMPPGRETEEAAILEHLRRGIPLNQLETVRRRKDGKDIDVSVTLSPIRDPSGHIIGAAKVARDISERRKIERAVEADRIKSEFLANMSHELRTPLNAIIGFTELMYRGKVGPVAPNHHEYLGDILTSSKHLLQLINDVLDLSKVESGKMDLRPEAVNLRRVVSEVRDILRGLISDKHIAFSVHIDESLNTAWLDPARLKQVLYNYLSNAINFTEERGRIDVRLTREGHSAFRLEVEDTGVGIRPEDMSRLFAEFVQIDAGSAKRYQGTGLGLALTKSIVELHGGRVEVRSTRGQGSTFCAVLPLKQPPSE
jgi:PAS domain S-box-containing protein